MSGRIEGVPVGTRLARIGIPEAGELIITRQGTLYQANPDSTFICPIIVPDNVYGVIDLSTVPIPEGWELDGETAGEWFRPLKMGSASPYISDEGGMGSHFYSSDVGIDLRRIHVRKIKPKTRRVLVAEWPIAADYRGGSVTVSDSMAKYCAESLPSVYRIEERPL